jgi:hypothetical protein
MTDGWYEVVDAEEKLTQGDLIFDCPILTWEFNSEPILMPESQHLQSSVVALQADLVIMTQACDLENSKVNNVILCPHLGLSDYKKAWEAVMQENGHNPTKKAWESHCKDIRDGYVWNQTMLSNANVELLQIEHRVVDFHEVYTLPRGFLELLLRHRGEVRMRLRPPYREHLSQAFARFFMRVGLPTPISQAW